VNKKKAVVLTSGGIDSTTVMAIARNEGFSLFSLSFNYGQRHSFELESARKVGRFFKVSDHMVMDIDLGKIGGSSLTDDMDVPKDRNESEITKGIPITYVPARNTIFLSYALAWAEVIEAGDIFIGVTAIDYSGYPDCRPEYIHAFEKMANLATRAGVENKIQLSIRTPLINMTKAEIITLGNELGVDYSITHSCYDPSPEGLACGTCDSCAFRKKGFLESGVTDPTKYCD